MNKIAEKVIPNQLQKFSFENYKIPHTQFSFKKDHSIIQQVLR